MSVSPSCWSFQNLKILFQNYERETLESEKSHIMISLLSILSNCDVNAISPKDFFDEFVSFLVVVLKFIDEEYHNIVIDNKHLVVAKTLLLCEICLKDVKFKQRLISKSEVIRSLLNILNSLVYEDSILAIIRLLPALNTNNTNRNEFCQNEGFTKIGAKLYLLHHETMRSEMMVATCNCLKSFDKDVLSSDTSSSNIDGSETPKELNLIKTVGENVPSKNPEFGQDRTPISRGLFMAVDMMYEIFRFSPINWKWLHGGSEWMNKKEVNHAGVCETQLLNMSITFETYTVEAQKFHSRQDCDTSINSFVADAIATQKNGYELCLVHQMFIEKLLHQIIQMESGQTHDGVLVLQLLESLLRIGSLVKLKFLQLQGYRVLAKYLIVCGKEIDISIRNSDVEHLIGSVLLIILECNVNIEILNFQENEVNGNYHSSIKNYDSLELVSSMMNSYSPTFIFLSLSIVETLINLRAANVVILQEYGLVKQICSLLCQIVRRGSIHNICSITSTLKDAEMDINLGRMCCCLLLKIDTLFPVQIDYIGQFLVILLYRGTCQLSHKCFQLPLSCTLNTIKCTHCEIELAVYECTNKSCMDGGKCLMCKDCDRVLHKAVSKRGHIRVPVVNDTPIIDNCENGTFDLTDFFSSTECDVSILQINVNVIANVLCEVLQSIIRIVDDKRNGNGHFVELLTPIFATFRSFVLTATAGEFPEFFINNPPLIAKVEPMDSVNECVDEINRNGRRLIVSLLSQLVSRFFVPSSQLKIFSDFEVVRSNIKSFCRLGIDAFYLLLITSETKIFRLTLSDKQFLLWSFREIIVTSFEVASPHSLFLVQSLVWLLNCPIMSSMSNNTIMSTTKNHFYNHHSEIDNNFFQSWGVANRIILERELRQKAKDDNIIYSLYPLHSPNIQQEIRLCVFQEVRLLLGGDSNSPLINNYLPCGHLFLPYYMDTDAKYCKGTVVFRFINFLKNVQNFFLQVGGLEILLDLHSGHLCNDAIKQIVHNDNVKCDIKLDSESVETWWSGFACLISLLKHNDTAKEALEASIGTSALIKSILRILSRCTQANNFGLCLLNIILEICTIGESFVPPSMPFTKCSNLKMSELHISESASSLCKMVDTCCLKAESCNLSENENALICLSPIYYITSSCYRMVNECVSPSIYLAVHEKTSKSDENDEIQSSQTIIADNDCYDDSTGRESISLSFHAIPNTFSTASLQSTLGEGNLFREENPKYRDISTFSLEKLQNPAEQGCCYISQHIPIFNFCLSNSSLLKNDLILSLIFNILLQKADIPQNVSNSFGPIFEGKVSISNGLLLQRKCLEQCLYSLVPSNDQFTWYPRYSKIVFRSNECVIIVLSLIFCLPECFKGRIIHILSHLIDGNPLNSNLISSNGLILPLLNLAVEYNERSRPGLLQIFSQLLSNASTSLVVSQFLSIANKVCDHDIVKLLQESMEIPIYGVRRLLSDQEADIDDLSSSILFILGLSIEKSCPRIYSFHDHDSAFKSKVVLPNVDKFPSSKNGYTLVAWAKLGSLGNSPVSTFAQLNVLDFKPDGNVKMLPLLTPSLCIFFRVVYKSIVVVEHAFDGKSINQKNNDKKRVLQLCISFYQNQKNEKLQNIPPYLKNSLIDLSSFSSHVVQFTVPDIVIDFDFLEMDDWHLISISHTIDGISCTIDGHQQQVNYWTSMGYIEIKPFFNTQNVVNPFKVVFPQWSRDKKLQVILGGLAVDYWFEKALDDVTNCQHTNSGNNLSLDLDLLQFYYRLAGGFCGSCCSCVVIEGVPEESLFANVYQRGIHIPLLSQFSTVLTTFSPNATMHDVSRDSFSNNAKCQHDANTRGRTALYDSESNRNNDSTEDEKFTLPKQNRRISRSLSPSSRYVDRHNRTSDDHEVSMSWLDIKMSKKVPSIQPPQQSSLMSDILTMFNVVAKDGDKENAGITKVDGSVRIVSSNVLFDTLSSVGGLKVWYPLLVGDHPHQIATLRILSHLMTSSPILFDEFILDNVDKVILYCLQSTPVITTASSMQILFDLTVGSREIHCLDNNQVKSVERISRASILQLVVSIAVSSPQNLQIVRTTIDWLTELCADSIENCRKVWENIGIYPFLVLLSAWLNGDVYQNFDINISYVINMDAISPPKPTTEFAGVSKDSPLRLTRLLKSLKLLRLSSGTLSFMGLQQAVSKLLKTLITASTGELPGVPLPISLSFSTGFPPTALQLIFEFIHFNLGLLNSFLCRKSDTDGHDAALSIFEHSIQLALDLIHDVIKGPLKNTILSMIRSIMPSMYLWVTVFELLNNKLSGAIKIRAFHLLNWSISLPDSQIDFKLVSQFEAVGGFHCISELLSSTSAENDTNFLVEGILELAFWRTATTSRNINVTEQIDVLANTGKLDLEKVIEDESDQSQGEACNSSYPQSSEEIGHSEDVESVTLQLPQILQCMWTLLAVETNWDNFHWAITQVEKCIVPIRYQNENSNFFLHLFNSNSTKFSTCGRNVDAFTSHKDWLIWISSCLVKIKSRTWHLEENALDFSGLESDDSLEGSLQSRRRSKMSVLGLAYQRFQDSIFDLVSKVFCFDILNKPGPQRKMYDVFRLLLPECLDVQLQFIFLLFTCFDDKDLVSRGGEISMNVVRNLGAFCEQLLEKRELSLDVIVKAIEVMNNLIFHSPPDIRSRIKETLLPEMRNTYVCKCLISRSQDLILRLSSISQIQTSILNLVISTDNKTIRENQVVIVLLDILVEACCDDTSLGFEEESVPTYSDPKLDKSLLFADLQIMIVALIQQIIQSSAESRKFLGKMLSEFPENYRKKTKILSDVFLISWRNDVLCLDSRTSSPLEESSNSDKLVSTSTLSWWGYWTSASAEQSFGNTNRSSIKPQSSELETQFCGDLETQDFQAYYLKRPVSPTMPDLSRETGESTILDISAFLDWFSDHSQREYIEFFHQNVMKHMQSVYRTADKVQEKLAQKRSRNIRQMQEKLQKEKLLEKKSIKETFVKSEALNERRFGKYETDMQKWSMNMNERILLGRTEFWNYVSSVKPWSHEGMEDNENSQSLDEQIKILMTTCCDSL